MARRDDREYREYLREEQRRQPGCPAREVVLDQRGQATGSDQHMPIRLIGFGSAFSFEHAEGYRQQVFILF